MGLRPKVALVVLFLYYLWIINKKMYNLRRKTHHLRLIRLWPLWRMARSRGGAKTLHHFHHSPLAAHVRRGVPPPLVGRPTHAAKPCHTDAKSIATKPQVTGHAKNGLNRTRPTTKHTRRQRHQRPQSPHTGAHSHTANTPGAQPNRATRWRGGVFLNPDSAGSNCI